MKSRVLNVACGLVSFLFVGSTNLASGTTIFDISSASGISGTITIDTVSGTVLGGHVTINGFSPDFTNLLRVFQDPHTAEIDLANGTVSGPNLDIFYFDLINGGSFVGFTGSTELYDANVASDCVLVPGGWGCNANTAFSMSGVPFGALTPEVSGVPEPSTWAMMLLGFAGLGFAFRQSRRKLSFA
jgi:PEP-CTERM motif